MFLKLTRSTLRALKFSLRVSTKLGRERGERELVLLLLESQDANGKKSE